MSVPRRRIFTGLGDERAKYYIELDGDGDGMIEIEVMNNGRSESLYIAYGQMQHIRSWLDLVEGAITPDDFMDYND